MAAPTVVLVNKPDESSPVGISVKRSGGKLLVSGINKEGLFNGTDLKVGMEVDSINGMKCNGDADLAVSMIKSSPGQVTIVAYPDSSGTVAVATPIKSSSASGSAPPGVPSGGVWGTNKYVGSTTQAAACVGCLCFCLPGLCILMCPLDERDAYKVDGKVRETNHSDFWWRLFVTFRFFTLYYCCCLILLLIGLYRGWREVRARGSIYH